MNEQSLDAAEREEKAREELQSFVRYLSSKYAVRLDIGVKLGFTALKENSTAGEVRPVVNLDTPHERDGL